MLTSCRHIAPGLAGISIATTFFIQSSSTADAQPVWDTAAAAGAFTLQTIASGYRAAPALMLGIGLLAVIPFLALAARITERVRRSPDATRRDRHVGDNVSADDTGESLGQSGPAFVEVIGARNSRYAIARDMLRIGREDDNDIRIPSRGVHRYHAAIHREDMSEWWITDLSGTDGNGVVVNGQKCGDARLHDGDVIELGPGRLKFHAGFA